MKTSITVEQVDSILRNYIPENCDKVVQAMEYSLFSGGKRIRPLLLLATCKSVSGKITESGKIMSAVLEFIHTYSLIHDDLPCMDNDDVRRGKRSCHMQFGEATAVLAGDGLLNLAAEAAFSGPINNKNYVQACRFMFAMSGIKGMVHGQSLDLFTETKTAADAEAVALHKTGDLIRAAIVCGALCGGAKDDEIALFDEIASKLGVCYQIVDDMLDAQKCENSFLDVYSERELKQYANKLTAEIITLCNKLPYDLEFVKEIITNNLSRKF